MCLHTYVYMEKEIYIYITIYMRLYLIESIDNRAHFDVIHSRTNTVTHAHTHVMCNYIFIYIVI